MFKRHTKHDNLCTRYCDSDAVVGNNLDIAINDGTAVKQSTSFNLDKLHKNYTNRWFYLNLIALQCIVVMNLAQSPSTLQEINKWFDDCC